MRVPIRSEGEAVRFVFASAAVLVAAVLVGILATPLAGVAVFAAALLVAAIAYLRADNPDHHTALRDAAGETHPHGPRDGTRHVLVVANETLAGEELCTQIAQADGELADARARLRRSLAWAREHGLEAHGEIGDPNPTTAIADRLRDCGADAVIVVTHPRERAAWQEQGELERLRRELDVPVSHVVVG